MSKTPAQRIKKHGSRAVVPGGTPTPADNRAAIAPQERPQSNGKMIVIAAVGASLFMFWYLHLLALNQMTELAAGHAMPDSMVLGFDPGAVEQLRAAMDTAARGQLNWIHKTAGFIFPLLFGLAWVLLIGLNTARSWIRWGLWALPLLFVVVRLSGNVAIDGLFGTAAPDAGAVAWASFLVVAGWVLFVLCLLAAVYVLWPRKRRATD
ncbi:hypothetical protein [Arthrobacter sp. NPDC090010]|uniref:hypothetical protein n=1 Tax=Arthrobacter sp. NPDC090010 TaxID=3363942 RepID=UPI003812DEBB